MKIRLTANGPIDVPSMLGVLSNHVVPGAQRHFPEERRHVRLFTSSQGPLAIEVVIGEAAIEVSFDNSFDIESEIEAAVRVWLDLDTDAMHVARSFTNDPVLGPLVAARPGLRVVKYLDEFEPAMTTVLGQQVSLAAGRTFARRLVAAYGTPGPAGLLVFPTPERLLEVQHEELRATVGLTNARAKAIHAVAQAFADGLTLRDGRDPRDVRKDLLAIAGVGPWTADYLAVRVLGDPDAFAPGDLVLRRALKVSTTKEALVMAEAWRPWRAYALLHLWTAETYL